MQFIFDPDSVLELWDLFAISLQPKEKSLVAEAFVNWLIEHQIADEDLEEIARGDSTLAAAIALVLDNDSDEEDEED
jgi:hypothetical protein